MDFVSSRKEEERVALAVMPNLQELKCVLFTVGASVYDGGFYDLLGLEYLISLQEIRVNFEWDGAAKYIIDQEKAALRRVVEAHPNHPILKIKYSIQRQGTLLKPSI